MLEAQSLGGHDSVQGQVHQFKSGISINPTSKSHVESSDNDDAEDPKLTITDEKKAEDGGFDAGTAAGIKRGLQVNAAGYKDQLKRQYGGVYHWATIAAGPRWRWMIGFFTCWINFYGWVFDLTALVQITANILVEMYATWHPDSVAKPWRVYIMYIGVLWISTLFAIFANQLMPYTQNAGMLFVVVGGIVARIPWWDVWATVHLASQQLRDNAVLFSGIFGLVNEGLSCHVYATLSVSAIATGLGAIPLGNTSAFLALTGSFNVLTTVSYAIPFNANMLTGRKYLAAGPFHLRKLGWGINLAAVFLIAMFDFFFCFTYSLQTSAAAMDCNNVILVGILVVSSIWWLVHATRHYPEPRVLQLYIHDDYVPADMSARYAKMKYLQAGLVSLALATSVAARAVSGESTGLSTSVAARAVSDESTGLSARQSKFVTTDGTRFKIDGVTKYYAGTNSYWISFLTNNADVDLTLDQLARSGLKILRIWGFNDVTSVPGSGTVYFQHLRAGGGSTINTGANGLQRLDYIVRAAERRGIKLIINFVNYWDDYGGMAAYVRVFGGSKNTWYTNAAAQAQYRAYIRAVVSRFVDSPAILAWELANEPRCNGCPTSVITKWATETSAYVKSLDPNHLVTLGDEGFGLQGDGSYPYQFTEGVDFKANLAIKSLDFGTFHLYPSHWGTSFDWGNGWVRSHAAACKAAGKPCVFEEYGAPQNHCALQRPWQVTSVNSEGMAADLFWQLGTTLSTGRTHDDTFTIYVGDSDWKCLVTDHVAAIGR
ncbi:hypothetical protein DL767_001271 [Monosporascus sp. MG133]|nr:hypothetical protein DL767_001271 [Monosporascus sp. MG133]